MRSKWVVVFAWVSASLCAASRTTLSAQDQSFPSNDEIALVLKQAERVFEQYQQSVKLEADTLRSVPDVGNALEGDEQTLTAAKIVVADLKKQPERFNGVGGLLLLSTLDDASRNSALCSSTAVAQVAKAMSAGTLDSNRAHQYMHTSDACLDSSNALYTVSENVHALLTREMIAQQRMNHDMNLLMDKCKDLESHRR